MAEHKPIQHPNEYTDEDYEEFEMKLFSQFSSVEQLEDICMTLAHLPTKEAQDLLEKFRRSERASEVGWLECAVDEGQYLYLSPTNDQEERDFLALKVIQEIEDKTLELQMEWDDLKLGLDKLKIQEEATQELIRQGELDADEALGFETVRMIDEDKMTKLADEMAVNEKIMKQIRASITTERYKNVDTMQMRHVHFT